MKPPSRYDAPDYVRLELRGFRRNAGVEAYHYRFDQGWAIMYLDESTGTVAIHSDYGDFTYSWPMPGRGDCTLKSFLVGCDPDYLACKFVRDRERFSPEDTCRELRREILAHRRDGRWGPETARQFWEEVGALEDDREQSAFYYRISSEMAKLLPMEIWEYFQTEYTTEFQWLKHGLLPIMMGELRREIGPRKVAA